jgi:hypothetical protein
MKRSSIIIPFLLVSLSLSSQPLQLLDRFNGNKVVNDSTITVFSSDFGIFDLTQYFTMKNNTDKTLAVYLRKTENFVADSTSDYYCFGIRCWPDGDDSTNVADSIPPGAEDYTFASHVTHVRRFDMPQPALPPGVSSITYTVYDRTTFPEPVEATVTVIYHLGGLGVEEAGKQGSGEAGNVLRVFPNPAFDKVTVEFDQFVDDNYKIIISNSFGAVLHSVDYTVRNNSLIIPVTAYSPGLYFGKLVSGKGAFTCFRFQVTK